MNLDHIDIHGLGHGPFEYCISPGAHALVDPHSLEHLDILSIQACLEVRPPFNNMHDPKDSESEPLAGHEDTVKSDLGGFSLLITHGKVTAADSLSVLKGCTIFTAL